MVGRVGTALGEHGVNISAAAVGRQPARPAQRSRGDGGDDRRAPCRTPWSIRSRRPTGFVSGRSDHAGRRQAPRARSQRTAARGGPGPATNSGHHRALERRDHRLVVRRATPPRAARRRAPGSRPRGRRGRRPARRRRRRRRGCASRAELARRQAARVAAAVEALVVVGDEVAHLAGKPPSSSSRRAAVARVALDRRELLVGQRARLAEDLRAARRACRCRAAARRRRGGGACVAAA